MLGLAGCAAVGPDYVEPRLAAPEAWYRSDQNAGIDVPGPATDLARWWELLGDRVLSRLIERAAAVNTDLRTAQARLREARARRALAEANLAPSLTGSASASRSRSSKESGSGSSIELYRAGFDASWEPDVFGGRRRAIEAAQADLEQSVADLRATRVSLAAEVGLNYVDVRAFQARIEVARQNLATQAETLQLTEWRNQAGLASALDVEQARTALEQTRAQIPALDTGLAQAQDRIATLLGQTLESLRQALMVVGPIPAVRERIAVGIPADVLRKRPDVHAAERRLAAETARIGQVSATRYPDFSLSGSIGLEALSLGALGSSGALAHSIFAGVSGVLFDAGRIRHQVEIQEAVRDQALAGYENTILLALQEVENALAALANGRARETALTGAVEAARNAARYALQRYTSGIVDFQAVLDTQRTQLAVEDALAAARADNVAALIRLYKALGGGWSPEAVGNAGALGSAGNRS